MVTTRMLSCLLLLLAVAHSNGLNSNCSNPAFENPLQYGFKQFPGMQKYPLFARKQRPDKWPSSNGKVCKLLAKHQDQSCCSVETLQDIEKAVNVAKGYVKIQRLRMLNESAFFYQRTFKNRFNNIIKLICLENDCFTEMNKLIANYENSMFNNIDRLTTSAGKCTNQLLNYFEGMLCFACDANWPKYVRQHRIVVATTSCTGIVSSCQPLIAQMQSFNKITVDFVNSVLDMLKIKSPGSGAIFSTIFKVNWPDGCGGTVQSPGNCKEYFCGTVLNGVGLPYKAIDAWNPWNHLQPRTDRRLSGDAQTVNIYADDGYDALQVGCSANDNCDNPDAGITTHSPTPDPAGAVAAVVLVLMVLAGGAVGGVFLWRKFKQTDTHPNSRRNSRHSDTNNDCSNYGSTII